MGIAVCRLAVLLALLWAVVARAVSPIPTLLLDYEESISSPDIQATISTRPSQEALQVDCSVARAGRCSIRSEVRAESGSISAGAYRAESDSMKLFAIRYSPGETWRYRFSLLLPTDWQVAPTSSIDILWQFKRFDSRPDMFVAAKGNALVLRVGGHAQVTIFPALPLGRWVDVVMEVRWSAKEGGWVMGTITTVDGRVSNSFEYRGPTTWNDKPKAAYLKWGLYKPGKTDGSFSFPSRRVWHDEVKVERIGVP